MPYEVRTEWAEPRLLAAIRADHGAATRTGMFGLAVVMASLYPGVTVLLARVVLGERLRWIQRAGLAIAALGILLIAI
jgi:drug/metabolite transporter (DMT)-like permease